MSLLPSSPSLLHNASCARRGALASREESKASRSASTLTSDRRQRRLSRSIRPRPGRRRDNHLSSRARTTSVLVQLLLLLLATLCTTVEAANRDLYFRKSEFARYAQRGEILIDRRPSPQPRINSDLHRRQGQEGDPFADSSTTSHSFSTTISIPVINTKTLHSTSTATAAYSSFIAPPASSSEPPSSPTTTSSESISAAASTTPLPRPFDTSLGSNFTSPSCPAFFQSFLTNATFTTCLPFSLLLQNSNSFFQASHLLTLTSRTLDAACAAPYPACLTLMSNLATALRSKSACGADFQAQNPVVLQAYTGLLAYSSLYTASCLKDQVSGEYCYAEAITNATQPADSYVYFLPLGVPLPQGAQLTCSSCLRDTMAVFNQAARNASQPVSGDYVNAAGQINVDCGVGFVNTTVAMIPGSGRSVAGGRCVPPVVGVVIGVVVGLVGGVLGVF